MLRALIAAALVATPLFIAAPAAHADADAYIELLDNAGIPYPSRTDAIHLGRTVCSAFDGGASLNRIASVIAGPGTPFTSYEAGEIIGAAVIDLCPEHRAEAMAQAHTDEQIA